MQKYFTMVRSLQKTQNLKAFWVEKAEPGTSYPLKYHKSLSCSHVSTLSRRKETSGSAATPTLMFKLSNTNEILETEETYQ